ncbi:MAG: hypothetical protein C4308_13395 [Chitinophagaceae bacterium]
MKITVVILSVAVFFSCSKSNDGGNNNNIDCSGVPKSFSTNVFPIISSRCAISGCHASGSTNRPGELTTYQQVFNARANIRNAVISRQMPQGSSLSQSEINMIVCWIDSGAPNN